MKIFDCVPFFNEFEQLRLRIACLEDVVDHFVVMEAHQTHTGKTKPLYLAESGYADLLQHPKVCVRAVDLPVGYSHWEREQSQREAIGPALKGLGAVPEDLVLVSDVDEIPTAAAVRRARAILGAARERTILVFEQRMFYFRLNFELVWSRKLPWLGSAAARRGSTAARRYSSCRSAAGISPIWGAMRPSARSSPPMRTRRAAYRKSGASQCSRSSTSAAACFRAKAWRRCGP